MDITFGELKLKILRILSDEADEESPLGGGTYNAELLKDSIHAALDALASRIWKPAKVEMDGSLDEMDLPADTLDVEAVYENTLGMFLPRLSMQVGATFNTSTGNGWSLYPFGTLSFINNVGASGCTISYSASWTKPVKDSEAIESPPATLMCLVLFAASYCLLADSVASANLGNFKTKVDSGQPTDNPAKEMSTFLLKRFEIELQRLPIMEKGRTQ